jgi:hypothetical protein
MRFEVQGSGFSVAAGHGAANLIEKENCFTHDGYFGLWERFSTAIFSVYRLIISAK